VSHAVEATYFEAAIPLPKGTPLLMTIFKLDQAEEEMLAQQISDEALELAGCEAAANYTLFFCTALDHCPGP
jgi:hypothetical protein